MSAVRSFDTLRIFLKRWDSVGTVIKWIAGTPDADDLRIINGTMNKLITNNNQQFLFNEALNSRVIHLTNITNELLQLDYKSKQQHTIEINLLTIILNIDAIQHQLEVLEDAILLAKNGIPSSQIFLIKDFRRIRTFLKQQQIFVSSFEDLLTRAVAKIAVNDTQFIYILQIPQLSTDIFDYEFVDPLIERRIHIQSNYIIKNKTHVFETLTQCKEENEFYLCESEALKPTSQCISNIINLQHANCTYEKVYDNGIIKRINEATLLLNNVNVTLQSNCSNNTQRLEGSYLINFDQCEIFIDNIQYLNTMMETTKKSFRPTTGILANENNIVDLPPPEILANLTIKHRSMLKHVYLQNESFKWKIHIFGSMSILTLCLIIGTIGLYAIRRRTHKNTSVEIKLLNRIPSAPKENLQKSADISDERIPTAPKESLPKSPYPDVSDERFQEIVTYFNTPTSSRPIRL
ncbi:uncharacterized protein LOC129757726 [Uranotaenia lowii]|uniref:uncharacterized protein LOC129757726 n=1 Tax=Uranotaenia lowii TaxID=190385 RepID=UPI0024783D66|nr:uncharacterized protein LOC129757726 [Uranotaenia lowii]